MSRQIDFTQPLSDADRQWLVDNGRFRDIETADAMAAADDPATVTPPNDGVPTGDTGTGLGTQPTALGLRQAEGVPSAPSGDQPANVALGATQGGPGEGYGEPITESQVLADEARTAAAADAPEGDPAHEDEDEGDNYDDNEAWSYRDLQEEVGRRRETMGDSYDGPALNSPHEDLVAWLRKDDERE